MGRGSAGETANRHRRREGDGVSAGRSVNTRVTDPGEESESEHHRAQERTYYECRPRYHTACGVPMHQV
jgi:hypothetical protein